MNRKTTLVAAGAALATAALGLGLDGAASAHTTTHTLSFRSHQIADRIINDTDLAASKELQNGNVTGYDLTRCKVDVAVRPMRHDVDTGKGSGTVTGGTGRFAGATGTITVVDPVITIHWSN
jgi:hypothetical protein